MRKAKTLPAPIEPAPIERARAVMDEIKRQRGMPSKIAAEIGIKPQAVHQWTVVPLDQVVEVERVTGIPRDELRPDFHLPNPRRKRRHTNTRRRLMSSSS